MLAELVLFGTFWFWAFILGIIVLEIMFMEYEQPGKATFTFLFALVGLTCFTDFNVFSLMYHHWGWTLGIIGSYGLIGGLYSIGWFRLKISNDKDKYRDMKESWLESQGIHGTVVPGHRKADFVRYASGTGGWNLVSISTSRGDVQIPARFLMRRHKAAITMRIALWPLSMLWTLLNDPIKKMAKWIYRHLQGIYQRITISATRDIVAELSQPEPPITASSTKSNDDEIHRPEDYL